MQLKKVNQIDYHRNGVSGMPFYVMRTIINVDGKDGEYLIIRPAESKIDEDTGQVNCFVLSMEKLPDIRFFHNSWRGDRFAAIADQAIAEENESLPNGKPAGYYD